MQKETPMPLIFLFSCEIGFFSFLLGAYFHSLGLGFIFLGTTGILLYALFQYFFSLKPFIWANVILGGLAVLFWMSCLDQLLNTSFIGIFAGLVAGGGLYFVNEHFLERDHL